MEDFISKIFTYLGTTAIIGALIWIGRKLQILDDMKLSMDKMKYNIKVICDALVKSNSIDFDHEKLKSYSPLQLTDKGKEFIKKIGFDKAFDENKEEFYKFINLENPKMPYDIELASIKAVLFLFDKDYFASVKDYLYNNPNEKKTQITNVLGIYIRDNYMTDHKN